MQSVLIQFDGQNFTELLRQTIVEVMQQQTANYPPAPPPDGFPSDEKMLTRHEVRAMFNTSLTTVDSWAKRKILKSTKLGGRRFFRQSDVEKLFSGKGKR